MTKRPRLRPELIIVAQTYRGEETYIVKDPASHKYFRFKPLEIFIMQQFTGQASTAELAGALADEGLALTAATLDGFAGKLSRMGLLERSLAEKSVLQLERLRAERRRRVKGTHYRGSLLRMRWSVGDPDRLFDRWLPRLQFFFGRPFLAGSVVLFLVYGLIAVLRRDELLAGILALYSPDFYTLGNVLVLYGTATVVIAIHELGHGLSCKYYGGHVHEMGAMLIYFQPAFYCNVNDAWTFTERSHRLWVTAAGSWIQLVIAGLAAIVWIAAQPETLVARIAFAAVLIGGGTTVLANANPLIPLDGYYALSDYLEIPNLRQRAFAHLSWLLRRYALRLDVPEPPADDRERRALLIYGALAVLYITTILTIFATLMLGFMSQALGLLGVLLFALLLARVLRHPLREWSRAVVTAIREHRASWRAAGLPRRVAIGTALAVIALLVIPFPLTVHGTFGVHAAHEARLGAPDDALVADVYVGEGQVVRAGTPLVRLRSFALERALQAAVRDADSLGALSRVARARGEAARAERVELARAEAEAVARGLRARVARLTLVAPFAGIVVTERPHEQVGALAEAGDPVLRLAALDRLEVRLVLDRAGAGRVRAGQPAHLISLVGSRSTRTATVAAVAPAVVPDTPVEARVWVAGEPDGLLPGSTGEVKVTVRRSNMLGAFWWGIRKRLRNDLFL